MVNTRKAQLLEGQMPELLDGLVDADSAVLDLLQ